MIATNEARRATTQPEWFVSWFDSVHYHRLYAHHDDQEAAGLIDGLIERHELTPGATVLDLGCGAGRHSKQRSTATISCRRSTWRRLHA
jgi:hypothetical protein